MLPLVLLTQREVVLDVTQQMRDAISVDFFLCLIRLAEQNRRGLGRLPGADQREGLVFHLHQFLIGRVGLRRRLGVLRTHRQLRRLLDRRIELRLEPAIALLPLQIARGGSHPR